MNILVKLALVAACLGNLAVGTAYAAPVEPPRLVVFIAIDGLPQRQVLNYRDQLAPDGFARFLECGNWFCEAHYGHSFTVRLLAKPTC